MAYLWLIYAQGGLLNSAACVRVCVCACMHRAKVRDFGGLRAELSVRRTERERSCRATYIGLSGNGANRERR
jgi:hypothetical protein